MTRGRLSQDPGAAEQLSHADRGARTPVREEQQEQRSRGERVLLSANDRKATLTGAAAERLPGTNHEGPLATVKTVDFALGDTGGHEGFFIGK